MAQKYALVLWTKTKKTSIASQDAFVKTYGAGSKEIPISEGAVRMVAVGDKRYEAEILRISGSKKYLKSLLVTQEGKVLLHGTKPSCHTVLAKWSKLLDTESEEQKTERNVLKTLNLNAEEQQPNTRLNGVAECSHGCPSCCSGTLPPFPTIPEGFVSTVVSLAEYFHQFHKSTIANIIAAGHVPPSAEPEHWLVPGDKKVELKKGLGVYINTAVLERIVSQIELSRKPAHQVLVKTLLTHLLGVEQYISTAAEKIDRRLMSAVVGFVNAKYPDGAQPAERYFRCINLNRTYLHKRKNGGALDDPNILKQYSAGAAKVEYPRKPPTWPSEEARLKFFADLEAKQTQKFNMKTMSQNISVLRNNSNILNTRGQSDQVVIPLDGDINEGIPVTSSNNINKIIVVHKHGSDMPASVADISQRNSVVSQSVQQPGLSTGHPLNGASSNRLSMVSSYQPGAVSSSVLSVTSGDHPIGSFSRGLNTLVSSTSTVTNHLVKSIPPSIPNQMSRSAVPANPVAPNQMIKNAAPANPVTPNRMIKSAAPANPVTPNQMIKSAVPANPVTPNQMIKSAVPANPVTPNQMTKPAASANPVIQSSTSYSRMPFVVPTNRVLVSTPNASVSTIRPIVAPSNWSASPYGKGVATSSTSPSTSSSLNIPLQSNKNVVYKVSSAVPSGVSKSPASAVVVNRPVVGGMKSQPVLMSGRTYSRPPKASSPDIEIISENENVPLRPAQRIKLEDNIEIEGALDISL